MASSRVMLIAWLGPFPPNFLRAIDLSLFFSYIQLLTSQFSSWTSSFIRLVQLISKEESFHCFSAIQQLSVSSYLSSKGRVRGESCRSRVVFSMAWWQRLKSYSLNLQLLVSLKQRYPSTVLYSLIRQEALSLMRLSKECCTQYWSVVDSGQFVLMSTISQVLVSCRRQWGGGSWFEMEMRLMEVCAWAATNKNNCNSHIIISTQLNQYSISQLFFADCLQATRKKCIQQTHNCVGKPH